MPSDILTVPEAAELLKVSERTMYTWTHRADFPVFRLGGVIRIRRDRLLGWMDAQETKEAQRQ